MRHATPETAFRSPWLEEDTLETMLGTVHLRRRVDLFRDAGLGWARLPMDSWFEPGTDRPDRKAFRALRETYRPYIEAGTRFVGISPNPKALAIGDVGSKAWFRTFREACRVAASELGDVIPAWQIGNELNNYVFRQPMKTNADAAQFIAECGQGLREGDSSALLGVNMAGFGPGALDLYERVYGSQSVCQLDYVGADGYFGSWSTGGPKDWYEKLDLLDRLGHGRPIVIHEFGFGGSGEVRQPDDLLRFVQSRGYASVADVAARPGPFLDSVAPKIRAYMASLPSEFFLPELQGIGVHVLKKWPYTWGSGHSPETQAVYLEQTLQIFLSDARVTGVFIYCWSDHETCWFCGEPDCPLETAWGLVDTRENPKPAYWAVKRVLSRGSQLR